MHLSNDDLLIREASKVAISLGKMFAPFCEVILHDLRTPDHSIVVIENSLSGRKVGDSATNIGLQRVLDNDFPDVLQNYPNSLPNGKPLKSTSIGIRNEKGICIAAICINMDISMFTGVGNLLTAFTATELSGLPIQEQLRTFSVDEIRKTISDYATQHHCEAKELNLDQKKELVGRLSKTGLLQLKNGPATTAAMLGVSRASIYNYQKT